MEVKSSKNVLLLDMGFFIHLRHMFQAVTLLILIRLRRVMARWKATNVKRTKMMSKR